jgi:hypothetical protein
MTARRRDKTKTGWLASVSLFWKVAFFLIGLPGIYVGVLSALPRVSVNVSELLDSRDPLSALISVNNDGYLTINSVQARCMASDLVDVHDNHIHNAAASTSDWFLGNISPDGRVTTSFSGYIELAGPLKRAAMTIIVSYRPDFVWWRKSQEFHFRGVTDQDGKLHWTQIP